MSLPLYYHPLSSEPSSRCRRWTFMMYLPLCASSFCISIDGGRIRGPIEGSFVPTRCASPVSFDEGVMMVEWSPPLRCPLDIKELAIEGRFIGMLRAAAASIEPLLFRAVCWF